ncbi:interleukin 1 receptor associated kinase 4 tube [Colletes latitarsis]|uniref:interleukin 1 receptor associated kinase 4 tube n=1 Tax=Colletes latitarsis TaxID=2605962 RepID=UPI004035B41E
MSKNTVCLDTELRKLRPAELYMLGQILNMSDSWKKLMAIVPKCETSNLPKFNAEHLSMIEHAAQQQRRNAAEIFLAEWGTMGRKRPTLRNLLNLLVKAELFRAADYLAGDILKEELPKRPECGPAAPVDISDEVIKKLLEEKVDLQDTDSNELLIFGLPSEANGNKVINNATRNSSLERNMQSTKLVSIKEEHNKKHLRNVENAIIQQKHAETLSNVDESDLMKFSGEHTKQPVRTQNTNNNYSKEYGFEKQEMLSRDLPVFLNNFGQSVEEIKLNEEARSDELPAFLNSNTFTSSNTLYNNSTNDSLNLSNLNINQNEITTTELPQCVLELRESSTSDSDNTAVEQNEGNMIENALSSQELPVTVLEYVK